MSPLTNAGVKSGNITGVSPVTNNNPFGALHDASDDEEDLLDKAWGLESNSRLSCQVYPVDSMTVIEIPKYTINQVSELT